MNGQKLFFLGLIILSLAMGQNWFKNRPKALPRRPSTPQPARTALNIDDFQIASDTGPAAATATEAPSIAIASAPASAIATETAPTPANEHLTTEPSVDGTPKAAPGEDPVMNGWQRLTRSPFEASPFLRMIEEAKVREAEELVKAGLIAAIKAKPVVQFQADFTGTIQTETEIVAIIDRSLFRLGKEFRDKKITNVEKNLVTLEDKDAIYLLPKKGWRVVINASAPPTLIDESVGPGKP